MANCQNDEAPFGMSRAMAEALSRAPTDAVLPFAFDSSLELIVDPSLTNHEEIYFNAGRLD